MGLDASFIVNTLIASAADKTPRKQEGMTTMTKKRIAIAAVAALSICAGAYGIASANFGGHRGHHGGGEMFLLAKAGGITHDQIRTAFQSSNVKSDFQKVKADQEALYQCFATNSTCSATQYLADKNQLETDKLNVLVGLFNGVPSANRTNIQSVLTQLTSIQASKKALMQQLWHGQGQVQGQTQGTNGDTPTTQQ
jgi:hypothetical protein